MYALLADSKYAGGLYIRAVRLFFINNINNVKII